jgi:hypothetical protein
MPEPGNPFTDNDFAQLMRVSLETVSVWRANGAGPEFLEQQTSEGVKLFYAAEAIRDWCLKHRVLRDRDDPLSGDQISTDTATDLPHVVGGAFQANSNPEAD